MGDAVPGIAELVAPASWRTVDFLSDVHLHSADPATFVAWQQYMLATPADAVFILGDLFEAWVGDDAAHADPLAGGSDFDRSCARVLRHTGERLALYLMHGNRDFLIGAPGSVDPHAGSSLMAQCLFTLLGDPTALSFAGRRWLLSHGDALCLTDHDYLRFREQVRSAPWQRDFLNRPLTERQTIARELRRQSVSQQSAREQAGLPHADVDAAAAVQWLQAAGADTLIHGHTHRPATHSLGGGLQRVVLSDWEVEPAVGAARADVLRLTGDGTLTRIALPVIQT